jgi:Rad17 P-loop domain
MKRSRIGGQVRLSWGGGDNLSTQVESRQRHKKNNDLWTDQFAPTEVADLCVAPKKVKQVQEWLDDGAAGMMILVGSPGIGKSTMVKLLCRKVHEWTEEPSCSSPIQSLCDFLQQSMYLDTETTVLLDELPYLHSEEMRQSFRQALGDHVLQCHRKTVWVYSNTMGGSHQPKELESLLDPQILYHSGRVKILQIHPVTTAKMKKVLQKVCASNRVALPDVTAYNGDLRHALLSLQFSSSTDGLRDTRLSPFHALGKLLYAKRRLATEEPSGRRPQLDFVPEDVVEQSGMPLFSSIYFLQGHAPDFFTDINELTVAFDTYSDACLFLNTVRWHRVTINAKALCHFILTSLFFSH